MFTNSGRAGNQNTTGTRNVGTPFVGETQANHKSLDCDKQGLGCHGKRQSVEMDATSTAVVCEGRMQVEDDLGDPNDTQVAEPGRRRWKADNVAKDVFARCVEDAAGRATAEF